ncbi:MAG TPA: hypothetical protein DC034_06530 [Clostridium sp.]|jgi:predicted nuclease of restriction endonuclease-like (RecB) superfamily|uniref:PDDEXK nuclease domain-containing protein n=1 Tax=Clostridium lapidicellarium TaxID=3240931 RepID=A0ABV4E0T0_9CLOT|nr:PDDEXK nuclease domain-containing protein [uncultured Clostridium sp.]HBC96434.1 hypothetical protein [Clostridium sp.]
MEEYHKDVEDFLKNLKDDVISSRNNSLMDVNKNMFMLYWRIGNLILIRQDEGCEDEIIGTISQYFKTQFPNNLCFSEKNLKAMFKFAEEYESKELVEDTASKIGWSCSIVLVNKVKNSDERIKYMDEAVKKGWTLGKLAREIDLKCGIEGDEEDNANGGQKSSDDSPFIKDIIPDEELTKPARGREENCSLILNDEYLMDFINCISGERSRYFQDQFMKCTVEFFLELDCGFALIGSKYHVEFTGGDSYIDLLFYNLKLRCHVAIELKVGKFKPEYLGILTFHLSILDESVKSENDSSSVGIIICKDSEKLIVQYAFKNMEESGNNEYSLNKNIPVQFQGILPTVERIGRGIKEKLEFV